MQELESNRACKEHSFLVACRLPIAEASQHIGDMEVMCHKNEVFEIRNGFVEMFKDLGCDYLGDWLEHSLEERLTIGCLVREEEVAQNEAQLILEVKSMLCLMTLLHFSDYGVKPIEESR